MRTKVNNSLQAIALGSGVSLKSKLRTKKGKQRLNELSLSSALSQQREEWLLLITELNTRIERVEKELRPLADYERVRRIRTYPGVGLLRVLCWYIHCVRSRVSQTLAKWLEPREYSSGEKQRFGGITKAGSRLLRFLLVEAGNRAVTSDEHLKKLYQRLMHRRDRAKAKVAVARHILIHAYIMLRDEIDYAKFVRRGVAARSARTIRRPQVPDHRIERTHSQQHLITAVASANYAS